MSEPPEVHIIASALVRREEGSDRRLARAAAAGDLARIRRGAYVLWANWNEQSLEKRHMLRVVATGRAARSSLVFSHESAALLLGLPLVGGVPDRPQVTVAPGSGLRSNAVVVRHEAPLDATEVIDASGIRVTDGGRTLVDIMATRSFLTGVCAAESALARGLLDHDALRAAIVRRRPFRGSRRAEEVARFASARSASPNESLCRVRFRELGFAQPEQQREYRRWNGHPYPVDFYWPEHDVICETDGRVKYESLEYLDGRTPEQALWDEKVREDELRAQCSGFVRLTWDDAWNRAGLIAKLARAGIPRAR